jgi:YfiH family protein
VESAFRLEERDGLVLARCEALDVVPGIAHAFSTRCDSGRSDFDLGNATDSSAETLARRARFLAAAGFGSAGPGVVRQVHGGRVVAASACEQPPEADAVDWGRGDPGMLVPSVRTADCVPVLLADAGGRAAAAVHAGWRGVVAGVVANSVEALSRRGAAPAALVAAIGPCIRSCCYEVGRDVGERVAAASGGASGIFSLRGPDRGLVDLQAAVREQLERAGARPASIHAAPFCTRCREDLFFSYRRDGSVAGRMMASVGPAS